MVHFGTGKMVEKSQIPSWKGKPQGRGPFERTACGVYVKQEDCTKDCSEVGCQSCKRTQAFRKRGTSDSPSR